MACLDCEKPKGKCKCKTKVKVCYTKKPDTCGAPSVFTIASAANTVCGPNKTTLVAAACSKSIQWYKGSTLVGSGQFYQADAGTYYAVCGSDTSNTITVINIGNCINVAYTQTRTATFTKNDCPPTCGSIPVTFTKSYQSTVSQEAADLAASSDPNFNTEGQAYANSIGVCIGGNCSPSSYSTSKTLSFTKVCPATCSGTSVPYTKTYTSSTSLAAAEALRDADIAQFNLEGQANANTLGTCQGGTCSTQYQAVRTANFTKSCPVGCTGSSVPYTQTYYSIISQLDADNQKAVGLTQFNIDGQAHANSIGTCTGGTCAPCVSSWILDTSIHTGAYCLNGNLVVDEMDSCYNQIKRQKVLTYNDCSCNPSICNEAQSAYYEKYFTKQCPVNCTGVSVLVSHQVFIAANSGYCACTQSEANTLAYNAAYAQAVATVNAEGQAEANANTTPCVCTGNCYDYHFIQTGNPVTYFNCATSPVPITVTYNGTQSCNFQASSITQGILGTDYAAGAINCDCCPTAFNSIVLDSADNCPATSYNVVVSTLDSNNNVCNQNVQYGWSTVNNSANVPNSGNGAWQNSYTFTVNSDNVTRYFFARKTGCNTILVGQSSRNCLVNAPTVSSIVVTQQPTCANSGNGIVTFTGVANGDRYRYCAGTSFTCTNSCLTPDGMITSGTFSLTLPTLGNSVAQSYTIRIYNGTDCNNYIDRVVNFNAWSCPCTLNVTQTNYCAPDGVSSNVTFTITGGSGTYLYSVDNGVTYSPILNGATVNTNLGAQNFKFKDTSTPICYYDLPTFTTECCNIDFVTIIEN